MKPRLLIASDCFLPRWDGITRFLTELIPALKKNYSITIIAPDFEGSTKTFKGVKIIRIKTYQFQVGDYSPPRIKASLIKEIVQKHDIIFHQTIGPIGAVAAIQGKNLGKKVVSFVHSLEWELFASSITDNATVKRSVHHITRSFVRKVYGYSDLLILPSVRVKRLMKELGIEAKGRVVKLGVDTTLFAPPKSKSDAKKRIGIPDIPIIGYAGRIGREKDVPTLLKAYSEVRKDIRCGLLIVGSGITIYDKKMKKVGVYRFGSTNRMASFLQAMDVYVLPSLTETSSLSTMEAMACGLPAFVTGVGETGKYVRERKTGFKFKIKDHAMLARKLSKVLINKKLIKAIGKNARQEILDHYRWETTIHGINNAFSKL